MDKSLAVKGDRPTLGALDQCERKIEEAIRRGIDAVREIGRQLLRIENEKLYELREYDTFTQYVEGFTRWDLRTARRLQLASEVADAIETAGLPMPETQAILCELGRLSPEIRVEAWQNIIAGCRKRNLALDYTAVRAGVNVIEKSLRPSEEAKRRGIESSLDKERIKLSETGERALERIRRLCGEPVAVAIEDGTIDHLSEDALIKWSEEEDDMVKNLAYYVIDQRWSVNKALTYERKLVQDDTTLEQLVLFARARGGKLTVQYDEFRLVFERIRSSDAAA